MKILDKYIEIEARTRAKRIETALKAIIPKWQYKLILKTKSRLLCRIFGYEIRTFVDNDKFEIWKRGKKLYYTTY